MSAPRTLFLDTSCLVKLYVAEVDSDAVLSAVASAESLVVSVIAELEFLSAIGRRAKDGDLTAAQYDSLLGLFLEDWVDTFVQQPLLDPVLAEARLLLRNYRIRTLDSLQLASALVYRAQIKADVAFLTADVQLAEVAAREGFVGCPPS